MIFAIFHNEDIHYEMLGYLIEYCQNYTIELHIYSSFINWHIGQTYSSWYNNFFKKPIIWKTEDNLDESINYDVVFLVTDDNPRYALIKEKYSKKVISIEHWYLSRCENTRIKIGTRSFFNRPEIPYAFPCYNIISEKEKIEYLQTQSRIQVVFVGRFNVPTSFTFSFFNNFENIDFHLIIWKMNDMYIKFLKDIPNFYIHSQIETEEMMTIMKRSHYVFFNPSYIEGYPKHKTSATLHLALSTLVKPIIPKNWNDNYNFNKNNVIEYDDLHYLTPNKQLNLSFDDYFNSLPYISTQRRIEISNRNFIFDNAIKTITGIEPKIVNKSWISNLFLKLCLNFPKVLVGIESYIDNNIIHDFREIHNINSPSTEDIISNKIYNYTGNNTCDIISNIFNIINKPVVFLIDENIEGYNFYNKIIDLISSRKLNDIIIINTTSNIGQLFQYKINYCIYYFINEPYVVLVPKYDLIENEIFQVCIKPFNYNKIPKNVITKIKESSLGYNYNLYNDEMILNIINNSNVSIQNKYNSCLKSQHKKDIAQMILLYNNGGIYVDIDTEPIFSFDYIIKRDNLNPTFVGVLSINKNDGLAIGLMACTKFNKIIGIILNELSFFNFEEYVNTDYGLICRIVGSVLKSFMNVEELNEGFYEIKGERILLLNEIWNEGDYNSCKIIYNNEILANTRYPDYPWNLNEN